MTATSNADDALAPYTDAPDNYLEESLWAESPLTDDDREAIRTAVRTQMTDIESGNELDIGHTHTAIEGLNINREPDGMVGFSLYLNPNALDDIEFVGDDMMYDVSGVDENAEPHNLRDLGAEFAALEADLVSEAVIMYDLPEFTDELEQYVLGGAGFLCTMRDEGFATFTAYIAVPGHIEQIYQNGESDIAEQLGLPIRD